MYGVLSLVSDFCFYFRFLFSYFRSAAIRSAIDGEKIYSNINNETNKLALLKIYRSAIEQVDAVEEIYGDAQAILAHYPDSPAGKALETLLGDISGELADGFAALKARLEKIQSDCLAK